MDTKGLTCQKGLLKPHPNGKEAENGSLVAHSSSGGSPSWRPVLCGIVARGSYPQSVRSCKMALARLDLHARSDGLGLSLAVPQPGPFLPRCGGSIDRLAAGPRLEALLGRHWRLLYGAGRFAGGGSSSSRTRHGSADRRSNAGGLALAWAKGPRGGRLHRD